MTSKFPKRVMWLVAISLLFYIDIYANLEGTWIQHPAATLRSSNKESQVDRIIDGNRYVYFSVRGGAFNRDSKDSKLYSTENGIDPLTLFRYDKTKPWEEGCITPVAREVELSGPFHQVVNYSPKHRVLAVAYDNGSVDFIYDDDLHIRSTALVGSSAPGRIVHPYSITFDDDKPVIYLAGELGVATVDIVSGEVINVRNFDFPVTFAARVGENMVVSSTGNNPSYIYSVNENSIQKVITDATGLQVIMPLSDNSFAALRRGTSDNNNVLKLFTVDGDEITSEDLDYSITVDNGSSANFRRFFQTDGYVGATDNGYAIQSSTQIILLKKDNSKEGITAISKSALKTAEQQAKASTINGEDVWFYAYDSNGLDGSSRGFYKRTYSNGQWSEPSKIIAPSGPMNSFAIFGEWNPEYGLICRGPGAAFGNRWGSAEEDYIFNYKDGKWQDLSYNAKNTKYRGLTVASKYVATEPGNSNLIWGLSLMNGLFRMNLKESNNFFMLGKNNSAVVNETTYPGFFRFFQAQNAFAALINGSNIDFDNEGRLWFARYWITEFNDSDSEYEEISSAKVPLYYYTKEELELISNVGGDKNSFIGPHEIEIPCACSHQMSSLCALKNEKNKNIIAFTPNITLAYGHRPFLFDHNGTPENPADDRLVYINELYDEDGNRFSIEWLIGIYEDYDAGELWLATKGGPFIMDPQEILNGNMTGRRLKITRKDGMAVTEYPLEQIPLNSMDFDHLGRKWLATEEGLFCLSKDGEELLGKYTVDNSPIPSDLIYDVVCSPEGIIFVLTSCGIAEFHPEGNMAPVSVDRALTIWPSTVTPDYNGYVTISGMENGSRYILVDANGNTVYSFGTPVNNSIQWNVVNDDGERVPAGKYTVKREDKEETHSIIIL